MSIMHEMEMDFAQIDGESWDIPSIFTNFNRFDVIHLTNTLCICLLNTDRMVFDGIWTRRREICHDRRNLRHKVDNLIFRLRKCVKLPKTPHFSTGMLVSFVVILPSQWPVSRRWNNWNRCILIFLTTFLCDDYIWKGTLRKKWDLSKINPICVDLHSFDGTFTKPFSSKLSVMQWLFVSTFKFHF